MLPVRRLAPPCDRNNRRLCEGLGGYFFFIIWTTSVIMPTINAQNWNSSVYVIISIPPLWEGKRSVPPPGMMGEANRLPLSIAPYVWDYSMDTRACPDFKGAEIDPFKIKKSPSGATNTRGRYYRAGWHTIGFTSAYIVPFSPGKIKSRAYLCPEIGGMVNAMQKMRP